MGDTALNVPVKVRSHELSQVKTMMPNVRDDLEQAGMDEAAAEVERIFDEHIKGVEREFTDDDQAFANYLSMPVEDWRMTIRYLNRASRTEGRVRVHWLQSKLVDRLEGRIEQMEGEE